MPPALFDAKHTLPHSLTPQMRYVLERMAKAGRPPFQTLTPAEAREAYEAGAEVLEETKAVLARAERRLERCVSLTGPCAPASAPRARLSGSGQAAAP